MTMTIRAAIPTPSPIASLPAESRLPREPETSPSASDESRTLDDEKLDEVGKELELPGIARDFRELD
jgi:hypothetical protein